MAQGFERIPLAVDSDFQMKPVDWALPDQKGDPWEIAGPSTPLHLNELAPTAQPRTVGAALKDAGLQVAKGAMNIAGAIPNLVSPEGDTAKFFNDAAKSYDDQQSDYTRNLMAAAKQRIDQAAATGEWDGFTTALAEYASEPALFQKFVLENAASFIPGLGAAKGAQMLGKGMALARGAAPAAAAATGIAAGVAGGRVANSALNAGGARQDAFSDIRTSLMQQGMGEAEATRIAVEQSRLPAVVGGAAGAISGGTGLERGILGGMTRGGVRGFVGGTAKELGGELVEELSPKVATNLQVGDIDPSRKWSHQLGETAAQTIIASAPSSVLSGSMEAIGSGSPADGDNAIPAADIGAGPGQSIPNGDGIEGDFIPADPRTALPNSPEPGTIYDQDRPALPPGQPLLTGPQPMDGDVLAPETLPAGQRLLQSPAIDGTATEQGGELARPALPPPEQGGPTERQIAVATGLLKHSPNASPDMLMRMMRMDQTMATMLFNHWQGKQNGQVSGGEATQAFAQGGQGSGADLRGSGAVAGVLSGPVSSAMGQSAQAVAPGVQKDVAVPAASAPAVTPLDVQAHAAATSPFNATPQPTEAQKIAGNYAKGHVKFQGMDIAIENPAGSVRSGKDDGGREWQTQMQHHYGYIKGTVGRDKDHLDVFIKPGAQTARMAYVIDQTDPKTGAFDEHKIIFGADSEADARSIYQANYEQGWNGLGAITAMPMEDFKAWINSGQTKKPLAYKAPRGTPAAPKHSQAPIAKEDSGGFGKVGVMPNTAKAVSLADNGDGTATVMRGDEPFYDFDSGEPVTVPAGTTPQDVRKAVEASGAMTSKDRWFATKAEESIGVQVSKSDQIAGKPVWEGRAQPSVDASSSTPFADPSPAETGEKAAIPSGSNQTLADKTADSKEDAERFERKMRAAASMKPAASNDVQTTALRYVPFDTAIEIAREAVSAGVKPVPAQFHTMLDLTMDSADRLISGLKTGDQIAGKPTKDMSTETLKQVAGGKVASPAAKAKATKELAKRGDAVDYKGFKRIDGDDGAFSLSDGNMIVKVSPTGPGKYQAAFMSAKSSPHLQGEQGAVDWADNYRAEGKRAGAKVGAGGTATPEESSAVGDKGVALESRVKDPRAAITKVRGGWTKEKIRKELKGSFSTASGKFVQRAIAEFDSAEEFADHIFYHGTGGYVDGPLRPSIVMSEAQAERAGGGGYGDRYWAVSVSKSKDKASNFTGQATSGSVYPVILRKGAKVINRPDIQDSAELEDIIEDLWNQGVDAVRIGDWNKEFSEEELAVLNPAAIFTYKNADSFFVYQKKKFTPLTNEQIEKIYIGAIETAKQLDEIRKLSTRSEKDAALNAIPKIQFSRAKAPVTGETTQSIRDGLISDFGKLAITVMERKGILRIVESADALPDGLKISPTGTALFDGKTAYLIADRMIAGEAKRELLHELGEHFGLERMLGEKGYAALQRRVALMNKAGNARVRKAYSFVQDVYPEYAEGSNEFFHEVLANIGQDADIQAKPWWKEMLASIKRFLAQLGFVGRITETDIQDMVLHSLKMAWQESQSEDSRGMVPAMASKVGAGKTALKAVDTESVEFKRWFGSSAVTDAEGKPLRVFHGTKRDFDTFKLSKSESEQAIFFTDSAEHADVYAGEDAEDGGQVMQVYLSMQNPYYIDSMAWNMGDVPSERALIKRGHDGIIIENQEGGTTYAVFKSDQAKSSISNSGAYSRGNPSILESRSRSTGFATTESTRAIQSIVDKFLKQFAGTEALNIRVAKTVAEIPARFRPSRYAEGVFHDDAGLIYLVVENLKHANGQVNTGRAWQVLMHEAVGHYGLARMMGERFAGILSKVKAATKTKGEIRQEDEDFFYEPGHPDYATWDAVLQRYPEANESQIAQEVLARMAETDPGRTLFGYVRAVVRQWLRDMARAAGFDVSVSSAEMNDLVAQASAYMRRGDGLNSVSMPSGTVAASKARGMESRGAASASNQKPQGPIWNSPDESRADDLIYTLQDKHIDLKRVQDGIKKAIGNIRDDIDAYLQEELFHGRAAKATEEFLERELNPFIGEMKQRGISMESLENFLWVRHAKERNAQIAKINPDMPDGGSGLTNKQADDLLAGKDVTVGGQTIKGIDQAKLRSLTDLSKKVDMMVAGNRILLETYELETADTVAAWAAAYKHYVPLHREDADMPWAGSGTGQGYSVKGSSTKRATGSFRPVENILANLVLQRTRTITRGEKNRVAQAMYGLAKETPNPDFWSVDDAPTIRTVEDKAIYHVMDGKREVANFTRMGDAEKKARENPAWFVYQDRGERVVEKVDPSFRSKPNVVWARFNGEDRFVAFNERDPRALRAAESLKNLDADDISNALGEVARWTRYFSSINTQYNPIFGVLNLFRDVGTGILNLRSTPLEGKQADLLRNLYQALPSIYRAVRTDRKGGTPTGVWTSLWEEFQEVGGKTGYRDMFRNSHEQKEALAMALDPTWWQQKWWGKTLTVGGIFSVPEQLFVDAIGKPVFEWLSDYNTMMENGIRLSAYKLGLEQGMSKERAASLAKNLTVNFNRKGQIARQAGALYAFFNASVQGTARMAETMHHGAKPGEWLGKAGKQIVYGGMLLGAIQALALMAAGFDDDEPPEFVRDRNVVIPVWGGKYLTVPLPLGFHVLPALGRIGVEFMLGGFKAPGKNLAHVFDVVVDAFNPIGNAGMSMQTIAPTVLDPLAALAENKDWTGKPIAREDMSGLSPTPGHSRTKDTASALSKAISYGVNALSGGTEFKKGVFSPTPDQLDYLIGQVTGGVGRESLKLAQTVVAPFSGEELPPHKIPLVGRFYGDTTGQAATSGRFYNNLKALNEHQAEFMGMAKSGRREQADIYLKENPEAIMFREADRMQRYVSKLRDQKRELIKRDAKSEEIRAIEQRITQTMSDFNARVDQRKNPPKQVERRGMVKVPAY